MEHCLFMVHLSHFKKRTKSKRIVIRLKLLPYLHVGSAFNSKYLFAKCCSMNYPVSVKLEDSSFFRAHCSYMQSLPSL